jgi:hypothetical protein
MSASKHAVFSAAYDKAAAAGREAGQKAVPVPMTVYEAEALSGAPKAGGQSWYCSEGACGFAWVTVHPGNCSFARWLRKNGLGQTAYGGGTMIWVSAFGQSIARKEACACAMAKVLTEELGIKAYAGSRLD